MIPTRLGQVVEGCMFVGVNRIQNCAYAVFVSPSETETSLPFRTLKSHTNGSQSVIDGFANTRSMADTQYLAAAYCMSLTVNGNSDFYLPAKNELELCYRALKPTNTINFVYGKNYREGNLSTPCGSNNSSIPTGSPYLMRVPKVTIILNSNFTFTRKCSLTQYWTSTESSVYEYCTLRQVFCYEEGNQTFAPKDELGIVRAVRRQLIVEI